ncbi:MAG: hypothetical protein MI673_08040, partial [Thiotrichales bacterium]|nr:hypothetical protein [Thiotrichales bacterium]
MDSTRFILILAIGLVIMMLIQAWEEDYGIQQTDPPTQADVAPDPAPELADVPEIPAHTEPLQAAPAPQETAAAAGTDHIRVVTDTYRLRINPVGGGID